jgi:microcystin-dependent protein
MGISTAVFQVAPKISTIIVDGNLNLGAYTLAAAGATLTACTVNTSLVNPTGQIRVFPLTSTPAGWLLCDGTAVSRTTYAALFAVISTAFGVGDGSTTFNMPNMKGKFIAGYDTGDADYNAIAKTGGEKTHALITAELAAHSHTQRVVGDTTNGTNGTQGSNATNNTSIGSTDTQGTGIAHENRPPFLVMGVFIKS